RALADTHLTLPALRAGPLPLPPEGRRGVNGKPLGGAGPGERGEALLRRHPVGHRLFGVFVAQLVEAEMTARDNFEAARQRVLVTTEQPRHLAGRFQMALGMGSEAKPGPMNRTMLADAGQHVLQRPPLGD